MDSYGELKLITGTANPQLAESIAKHVQCRLTPAIAQPFSDGEIRVEIGANVRGKDVFVIQSTCRPVNNSLIELCLMLDALKRASARRITAVVPYYGYARQDRKVVPRVPISAKMVADFLMVAGAGRLLTMDLHAGQIQGFFDKPVDNLYASKVLLNYLRELKNDLVLVSPDAGGTERARAFAKQLQAGLAIVDKRRDKPNQASAMHIIGQVEGKTAVIVDDMVDTAGTLVAAADALFERGATHVYACVTHPVLSGPAIERINSSRLNKVVVTDTIPLTSEAELCPKIEVVSVAELFAKAIKNINQETSISGLFTKV